jgi:hypothetical protein
MSKTIDEIFLKPAHWRLDDYQQAKRELREVIERAEDQTDYEITNEDYSLQTDVTSAFKRNLFKELGL